jgi:Tol biopolymer transport system component
MITKNGQEPSFNPAITANGRLVAFNSAASNLVPGDTNQNDDVFLHDRGTGSTIRVSVGPLGVQGNGSSDFPAISTDGRFVAFQSSARNLVPGDTNGFAQDVFVRDRQTRTTELVSVATSGAQGNNGSNFPAISPDGRFVAFESEASNLVPSDTNRQRDVFVHDRQTGRTERVSVSTGGVQGNDFSQSPAISANGRFVAFESFASNLVSGDTNGSTDVFVHDRHTGTTRRVSVGPRGAQGDFDSNVPAISADGRFVAFESSARNLVPGDTNSVLDVFVRDRQARTTRRVSVRSNGAQGDDDSGAASISPDGRFVAFFSAASNLVPRDTNNAVDVFLRDRGPVP